MTATDGSDVDVVEAIIVVITHSATKAVHFDRESSLAGHVSKRTVAIVVVKSGVRLRFRVAGPVHGIDKENVLPTVIVVIEHAHAAAHRLGKILRSKRTAVVLEADARLRGHIRKYDRPGRTGWNGLNRGRRGR